MPLNLQVSQIHRQLPPGGILVFVTGQREVESLCKRLRSSLCSRKPALTESADESRRPSNLQEQVGDETGIEDGFGEDAAESAAEADGPSKGTDFLGAVWHISSICYKEAQDRCGMQVMTLECYCLLQMASQ